MTTTIHGAQVEIHGVRADIEALDLAPYPEGTRIFATDGEAGWWDGSALHWMSTGTAAGAGDVIQDGSVTVGHVAIFASDHHIEDGGVITTGTGGGGDFSGPGSSTDNAVVRFDGAGGKTGQNSLMTIDDAGTPNIPTGTYNVAGAPHTHAGGSTPTFVGARIKRATDQSINDSSWTAIQFDVEDYDSNAFHDNSTNNTRITIPAGKAGYYSLKGRVQWDVNGSGNRYISFRKGGSTYLETVAGYAWLATSYFQQFFTIDVQLAEGEYIELCVYQDSSGALNVKSATFSAALLGA